MTTSYKDLHDFVTDFIEENHKIVAGNIEVDIDKLQDIELEEYAATLMAYNIGNGEPWDWLMDSSDSEDVARQLCNLINKSHNPEVADDFIRSFKSTAIKNLREKMQFYIDEFLPDWMEMNPWTYQFFANENSYGVRP